MPRELHPDEPLDEGYWANLGVEGGSSLTPFDGPAPAHDKDPFAGQDQAEESKYVPVWLKTYGGIEFVDIFVGDYPGSTYSHELVFLYQVPGADPPKNWILGRTPSKTTEGSSTIAVGVTYEEARKWAEDYGRNNSVDAGGAAEWRQGPASQSQVSLAQMLKLRDDSTDKILTKGKASDLLNRHFGSKLLDPSFAN